MQNVLTIVATLGAICLTAGQLLAADAPSPASEKVILTPKAPAEPRINGSRIFGVRPGRPFLFTIPATGDRPMKFSAEGLPAGLQVDEQTGRITGKVDKEGEYKATLKATNAKGSDAKPLKIVVGDTIALTPPMGWNSWNCWGPNVDQAKVQAAAQAMVKSGLVNHGWTYINIDDAWQLKRGGDFNGIQPNEKFPDMKGLCDEIHGMGLKVGIYSTPWVTSYAGFVGGSANNSEGTWTKPPDRKRETGKTMFAENDAKQWAAWGMDYVKYDWNPNSTNPKTSAENFHKESSAMAQALIDSGRDMVYSYSNSMPFDRIEDQSKIFNSWRTTGDIRDSWWSLIGNGIATQNKWAPFARPGHWNDPDMLIVGHVGGWSGAKPHPTNLTPDEQYSHISLWSLLASPMLIGCDMDRLDEFTISLLSNDEVIAVNQDPLGKQATIVSEDGSTVTLSRPGRTPTAPAQTRQLRQKQVWARELEDGSHAVGLFNLGDEPTKVTAKWADVKVTGKQIARDLWRQQDVGTFDEGYEATVPSHGVVMIRLRPAQ